MKIHFQKFFSVLCVIVLLFSFSVSAFADEGIDVKDGYNIDCVPYSPYISSLVVTDNIDEASVYYSSSKARTYSATASTFSVSSTSSDTSTDYLYSFSDYMDLFPGSHWNPGWYGYSYYDAPVLDSNGKRGVHILIGENNNPNYHQAITNLPELTSGNKYSFSFTIVQNALTVGTMYFRFFDSSDESKYVDVFSMTAKPSTGAALKVNKTITGNIIIPDDWSGTVSVLFRIENMAGSQPTIYINNFTIVDVTNENLDKSLDKFGDRLENAGSDEPPLDTDISAFQSAIDTMNGWLDQLDQFADTIDTAGQTANEYISKGTEIFNGFMSVAPASVIALVAFGVVFIVVRKIVGR